MRAARPPAVAAAAARLRAAAPRRAPRAASHWVLTEGVSRSAPFLRSRVTAGENDRGVSFTFGEEIVADFLRRHDFDLICRAHQVVEDGYEFFADRQLVTIFSAPNYCGEFDNAGAVMAVDESLMCSFRILKPGTAQSKGLFGGGSRPLTPPRKR